MRKSKCLCKGRGIHLEARRSGHNMDVFVASRLVEMYAKGGSMLESRGVFEDMKQRDLISWNCIISGYADSGDGEVALELYDKMHREGFTPNAVTVLAALKACAAVCSKPEQEKRILEKIRAIHSEAREKGIEGHSFLASSLLDAYVKSGSLVDAREVFDKIANPNAVAWTSVIRGYAESGEAELALELYSRMPAAGCTADAIAYAAALKACGNMGALESGKKIEAEVRHAGLHTDVTVLNSLIGFYGKCGSIADAEERFLLIKDEEKDLVTWTSMLDVYSCQGDTTSVFEMSERLEEQEQLEPNEVTFLSILSACNHAGLVIEGKKFFEKMERKYGLKPGSKHYGVMIDLLGQANKFEEALAMVGGMDASEENVVVLWTSLLDACLKWRNEEIARVCFDSLQKVGAGKAGSPYVLLANYMRQEL